ncbi:MAG: insulinase family protein [Bacteroidales bacterium]|nr:insulinase family protein [Bacteroidales bacterium]
MQNRLPAIKDFDKLEFKMPYLINSEAGIPIYVYDGEKIEVCRVDIIFFSGSYNEKVTLTAQTTAELITEATLKKSSSVFTELIDFYGGWITKCCAKHFTTFTLYAPVRTYKKLLPLFFEAISSPRFSKRDLERYKRQLIEGMKVNKKKVDVISSEIFRKQLFGSHPYGVTPQPDDCNALNNEILKEFHNKWFYASNCNVVISGAVTDDMVNMLQKELLRIPQKEHIIPNKIAIDNNISETLFVKEVVNAMQSSVRIGARVINNDNADHYKLQIVNTALGGYFGSRLSKNIREEKGYTYGIYSGILALPDAAHFMILSQTGINFTKPLIKEVEKEIIRIKEEPIPNYELTSLKGYMLGSYARMFDTRFTLADAFISLLTSYKSLSGKEIDFKDIFNKRINEIKSITANTILETAQKYLPDYTDMITVVAGKFQ